MLVRAISAHEYTEEFLAETERRPSCAPRPSLARIESLEVGNYARHVELAANMFNCGRPVGLGSKAKPGDGIAAEALMRWLHELKDITPHLKVRPLLAAWSPEGIPASPAGVSRINASQLTEERPPAMKGNALLNEYS
ncbi:hypothetical protein [Glutamicibacter sp.]|uniref:hypothetical protein n=1 Tax=Glutamicibacter sp. TaxID=1931995 RepID=UPI003D6A130E